MTSAPPLKDLMTPPDRHVTIYVWQPSYSDFDAFPITRSENLGAFQRISAGFPVADESTKITQAGVSSKLAVYRQSSFEKHHHLFSSLVLEASETSRALPEGLETGGSPILREDLCEIIQNIDPDGGHQYIPCPIKRADGSDASDQRFFHFVCGRRIGALEEATLGFDHFRTDMTPEMYRRALYDHPSALALAEVPVWSLIGNEIPLFFSQAILDAAKLKGLNGLKEFTVFNGAAPKSLEEPSENIGHIWISTDA